MHIYTSRLSFLSSIIEILRTVLEETRLQGNVSGRIDIVTPLNKFAGYNNCLTHWEVALQSFSNGLRLANSLHYVNRQTGGEK